MVPDEKVLRVHDVRVLRVRGVLGQEARECAQDLGPGVPFARAQGVGVGERGFFEDAVGFGFVPGTEAGVVGGYVEELAKLLVRVVGGGCVRRTYPFAEEFALDGADEAVWVEVEEEEGVGDVVFGVLDQAFVVVVCLLLSFLLFIVHVIVFFFIIIIIIIIIILIQSSPISITIRILDKLHDASAIHHKAIDPLLDIVRVQVIIKHILGNDVLDCGPRAHAFLHGMYDGEGVFNRNTTPVRIAQPTVVVQGYDDDVGAVFWVFVDEDELEWIELY